jgi:hypothetical protein
MRRPRAGEGGANAPCASRRGPAPTATRCGHIFCWKCIAEWCNEKPVRGELLKSWFSLEFRLFSPIKRRRETPGVLSQLRSTWRTFHIVVFTEVSAVFAYKPHFLTAVRAEIFSYRGFHWSFGCFHL